MKNLLLLLPKFKPIWNCTTQDLRRFFMVFSELAWFFEVIASSHSASPQNCFVGVDKSAQNTTATEATQSVTTYYVDLVNAE
jgi:hypothetical protein